jgi:uncharacterized phiE125 gp8 family phage protein
MISLNQSVAPSDPDEPVTLQQAKDSLHVTHNSENSDIALMVSAARALVETRANCKLLTQTYVERFDFFPGSGTILLSAAPAQSITSIAYIDLAGDSQTLAGTVYDFDGNSSIPRVFLKYGQSWPSVQSITNAITVTYVAGYGDTSISVPPCARRAILLAVGSMYRNRETTITGTIVSELKGAGAFDSLIDELIQWRFA